MSNIPASYWAKQIGVELVAKDRTHVLFRPDGDTLHMEVELPNGYRPDPISFRADMIEMLAEALAAWQGTKLTAP